MDATAYSAAIGRRSNALSLMIRGFIAALLCVLLLFAAIFLLARRCVGALNEPLSAAALIALGVAAAIAAEAIRLLNGQAGRWSEKWLPRLSLPAMALAVSLPASSTFGLAVLWLTVVGEELQQYWIARVRRTLGTPRDSATTVIQRGGHASEESSVAAQRRDQTIAQQIAYRSTAEGNAVVEGWLCATFIAAQRTAIVHVAFCPPFHQTPQVEVEPLDGPSCDIRSTLVLPWGVRWEVKLAEPATQPASVVLEFFAAEPSADTGP